MDDMNSNILNVALADYTPVSAAEKVDRSGWVNYGLDNLFPQYLRDLAETSPIHGSLCISIADMIAGKGLSAGDLYQERIDNLDVYSVYYSCAHDYKKYGGFYIEVIYSMDRRTIAKLKHIPFEECRIAATIEEEDIIGVYHSNDWSAPKKKKNKPTFIPKYNPVKATEEARQMYYCFNHTSGLIYPRPDYWSAVNYIELSKQIGIFHVNGISNGLFPSTIVSFFHGQIDPEEQRKMMSDWERKLSGARNAGKFIMTFNEAGAQKPEITTFPLSDADKLYEYLTNTSRTEVMTAHRVTTPLLFGIRGDGSGFGNNKDEMAVGLEIFMNQVIEPAQRKIQRALEEILRYEMESLELVVIANTPLKTQAMIDAEASQDGAQVSATALNGAQIASMVDILVQAASGILPVESAKGVMSASFPTLTAQQIDDIFSGIVAGSVDPNQLALESFQLAVQHLTSKKKRGAQSNLDSVADKLIELGEEPDADWILIDSFPVDYDEDEDENTALDHIMGVKLIATGTARPNSTSEQDKRIDQRRYYVRYRYTGEVHPNTREFCSKMISANKLYRKEDIMQMGKQVVNEGWGPRGADRYSIWLYKGGGSCGHVWTKELYISAKGFGLDISNPKVKQQAWEKAAEVGYKVRNNWLVETKPRDMPYRGFLPDNPRYDYNGNPRNTE